ncbi:hypothetical protein G7Y89_g2654 [Cudoniella acicularis]|uniref:U6 snRNA phosphodiesterase n=1 Tax=Cudoniella acicularis TaxID=354080 RepID=A0A8H4W960_9HELO|nr:hypothetical protein G7Y89_g2654 [Cudoniella acicularis]
MALVDYISSDEDETLDKSFADVSAGNLKRKRDLTDELPPLPSKFHDLYASTTRVSTRDDPSLHGGRKRVTPHVEGNWPTHLYVEWYPSTSESESLSKLISIMQQGLPSSDKPKIHSFLTSDLGAPLPLHISLSRPIGFPTELKDDFVTSLERTIKSSGIRPFEVAFSSIDWVANFENTRWFLVLKVETFCDSLNKLLHVSNMIVQDYKQPPLYAMPNPAKNNQTSSKNNQASRKAASRTAASNARTKIDWSNMQDVSHGFHVSIAWMLDAPPEDFFSSTKGPITTNFKDLNHTRIKIGEIKAKVGNIVTNIPLQTKIVEGERLFGF